ncbi:unnamed protein product [Mycena citricolor]|uniref:ATP-dependent DNA helicase n=1 Tax=Mycena citricolor TaxID=2018698 RepID=A0AAD2K8Z0_9AGAR|nr:unnamed protein product [Mycena citricolor]
MADSATPAVDVSILTVDEMAASLRSAHLVIPRSVARTKASMCMYARDHGSHYYDCLVQAASDKASLKRKMSSTVLPERSVRRKLHRLPKPCISHQKDPNKYLALPDESQTKDIYQRFYDATSNAAVLMMICGVCAREVGPEHDRTPRRLSTLPNVQRLVPHQPHPSHTLFEGKLLEPQGVFNDNGVIRVRVCEQCSAALLKPENKPPKFSLANNMWIGPVPWQLHVLTFPEQLLIALLYPRVFVFKLHPRVGGRDPSKLQRGMRGTVSTYELDSDGIASMLAGGLMPRPPAVLASVISLTYIGVGTLPKHWLQSTFRVRRKNVFDALSWLKQNNPKYYGSISIDASRIAALPEDDVPPEILSIVRQTEDVDAVNRESDSYVRDHHSDEQANGLGNTDELDPLEQQHDVADGSPDVIPLDITGTIDTEMSTLSTNELMQWGLANLWQRGEEGAYAVRHGTKPVSDFGRPPFNATEALDPDRPNFFERAYPCLYPFGVGGLEADRPVDVKFGEHVRWSLEYHDRRFRLNETFPFVVFGISQRRQALMSARIQMRRKDFERDARIISSITQASLEKATSEEARKEAISDPAVRLLRQHVHSAISRIQGSNQSRTLLRSQLWSTTVFMGPWNLWITINPSDIHDPIAQVFAGADVDLDNFVAHAGPDSDQRGRNIAADPYAAAKFFHFMIRTILEVLFGVESSAFQVTSQMGILGELAVYFGLVESQNRAALHFHLLAALKHAPNADEMAEFLKSELFRSRITAYIQANMRAYLPGFESDESVKAFPVEKEIAYNRPPKPDDPDYNARLANFERRVVRTEQVHTCDIRRCLVVTKSGRLQCKRRAPFQCATEDFVLENGECGPKRHFGFMNSWIPGVSINVRCNNDIKFLSHGSETQKITMYVVGYAAKPQMRHHNISAILANGYAYHVAHPNTMAGELVESLRDKQRLLLFRLVHAINREQELGAPMVISYLMGWGDNYRSHNYVPIYWSSFLATLFDRFPDLKCIQTRSASNVPAQADSDTNPSMSDDTDSEGVDNQNVTISLNSAGHVFVKSQVTDYTLRGDALSTYNMLDFFVDTYEGDMSQRERESVDLGDTSPADARPKRGRPRNMRVCYQRGHPSHSQKHRIIRLNTHNTLPNFIGPWFPRRDDDEKADFYHACMLMLLKPWRILQEDLKTGGQTWATAFEDFYKSSSPRIKDILANIQYYHQCQSAALAAKDNNEMADSFGGDTLPNGDETLFLGEDCEVPERDAYITEESVQALINGQMSARENSHGQMALEIARLTKIFPTGEALDWSVEPSISEHVAHAVGDDLVKLIEWRKEMDRILHVQNGGFPAMPDEEQAASRDGSMLEAHQVFIEPSVERITLSSAMVANQCASSSEQFDESIVQTLEADFVLQPDQQRAYDIVVWHLRRTLAGDEVPPLRMLIHGEGGTGKSKVISKITRTFDSVGAQGRLIKAAYTGIAASLIDGKTTHIIGAISAGGKMSDASRARLQDFWRGYSYLIIDEISMISKDFLSQLSRNIGIAKASSTDKSFGGISVIFCGDFHQFPPVAASPTQALYYPATHRDGLAAKLGRAIYEEFSTVVILKQQMRVTDHIWLDFLRHLRMGRVQDHHLAMLRTLVIRPGQAPEIERWKETTLVTPRHGVRLPWNGEALRKVCREQKRQIFICPAEDRYRGQPLTLAERYALAEHLSTKKRVQKSMERDLPYTLELAVGMQVLVTSNIETDLDLTNGARGVVQSIILDPEEGSIPNDSVVRLRKLPMFILVKFERTRASTLKGLEAGVLPIEPGKTTYRVKTELPAGAAVTKTIQRRQFPLTGAYAFTDYRSQGQTLKKVLVDIATPPSGGLNLFNVYVALSRSSGRETIRLLRDFDDSTFKKSHDPSLLAEDDRLEKENSVTKEWWDRISAAEKELSGGEHRTNS